MESANKKYVIMVKIVASKNEVLHLIYLCTFFVLQWSGQTLGHVFGRLHCQN